LILKPEIFASPFAKKIMSISEYHKERTEALFEAL
jgi:hypothetical protein